MRSYWNVWHDLGRRERYLVGVAAVALSSYFFNLFIYSPVNNIKRAQALLLQEKKATLAWMETVRQQHTHVNRARRINNAKLLALLSEQLQNGMLQGFAYQLQQIDAGDTQLSFGQVPFNTFLIWLKTLTTDYAIMIKDLKIERLHAAGLVKVVVILTLF